MGDEFDKEFLVEIDHTKAPKGKSGKTFKPGEKAAEKLPTWGALHSPSKHVGNTSGERKWYSVWEDKIIVENMRIAEQNGRSFTSIVEPLSKKLLRTVESVKERHKRWIKVFTEEDRDKIVAFCKGKSKAYCREFAVRRNIDKRKGTCELTEIIRVSDDVPKVVKKEPEPESEDEPLVLLSNDSQILGKREVRKPIVEETYFKPDESLKIAEVESPQSRLKQKVENFKRSLMSDEPEDVERNSLMLQHLLKQVAVYHSVSIHELVARLENGALNMESLRQQLCAGQAN